MRKIHILLIMLVCQLISLGSFAQKLSALTGAYGDPLITDAAQLSSNASDEQEGLHIEYLIDGLESTFWHSDWHGKVSDPHYIQVALNEPLTEGYIVMYMQRRQVDNGNHLEEVKMTASADGETWEDLAEFTLGNAVSLAEVVSEPIPIPEGKSYAYIRVINNSATQKFFHAVEFELYNPKEFDLVCDILDKILTKYNDYLECTYEVLNVGTEFGQFTDKESADKIIASLDNVMNMISGVTDMPETTAEAQAISTEIDEAFTKFWASEVLYKLPANGYYRIIANLAYKEEITEGEGENMQIVETNYMKKALFCGTDYKGMWGNVKEDMANYVWKLTENEDGTIDMYNVGMEARFSIVAENAKLAEDGDKQMIFDFAGNEDGNTIIYIREASTERGASNYIHQWYHNKGTQKEDKPLTVWKGTFDMGAPYDTDKGTSEWYLEPVNEEDIQALVDAFAPIKNHDILVEQNAALRAEVKEAIFKAKDQFQVPLLTSGEQMSSIWSQNRDGNSTDGGNLIDGVLIDGNASTYWHSIYQNQENFPELTGNPYIQIADMSELVGEMFLYVKRRTTDAGHSVEYTLVGSNNPEAPAEEWDTLAVVPLGNASSGQEYTSPIINVGNTPYSYIRIYNTNSSVGYMHAAELQIYKLVDNPNSQFVALGELATTLENTYLANIAVEDDDITLEIYNALKDAYNAFRNGMCDPTELRSILAKYATTSLLMVEGTNPGQWSSTQEFETFNNLYKEAETYNTSGTYTQAQLDRYAVEIPLAAANFMASANAPKANTWYRIKFPSEELYDKFSWDKSNSSDENVDTKAPLYDNYLSPGYHVESEEFDYFDYFTTPTEDIREGSTLCAFENSMLEDDPDASMFRFIEVEAPLSPIYEFQTVMSNARQAIKLAANITVGEPLIKDAKQLSSNASDQAEGKFIEYLVDNNIGTFWHSDWHGAATAPHYLQVSFPEPVSGIIEVDMTRRQGAANGDVLNMYVTASNDGENWDKIGYIYLPFVNAGEQVYSTPIDLNGSYTYLRFTLTQRRGDDKNYDPFGEERTYFHAAEFQIRPVTVTGASENAIALNNVMREVNKVLVKDLTDTEYTTLVTAYNALQKELNATKAIVPAAPEKIKRYAIQQKTTGLFVNAKAKNDRNVTLQLTPSIITHSAIGCGENAMRIVNLDSTYCAYLHVQRNIHQLVTWDQNDVGSNSGLMLEEVEEANEEEFTFIKDIVYGKLYGWCYPVSIATENEDMIPYTVAGVYTDEDNLFYLALDKTQTVEAGQPVIFVYGMPDDYIEPTEDLPEEIEPMTFTLNSQFNFTAGTQNGLVGNITAGLAPQGAYTFVNNTVAPVEEEAGAAVAGNTSYLDLATCPEIEAGEHALSILLGEKPDGISNTLEKVAKSGNIYSADGKLVRANGTLNDMQKLGKGIYILNGVKVLVK